MMLSRYRPDIDGIRAIAVLSVVLYHFKIGPFYGGFVGVDIFFVVSGYLITGIIHKEIERESFTFSKFYARRARRIFPALFLMIFIVLVFGAIILFPTDLVNLGNSSLSTLIFSSNILFWRQSGYFDASTDYNPLLHTWSLSVEEQFYIFFPILLIILHRYAKSTLKSALVACAIFSFILCVWLQPIHSNAVFFLAPFRAWELLLGSLIAVGVFPAIRNQMQREVLAVAALAVMLGSIWWTKAGAEFPGWQAVFPVIATAVLLHTGRQDETIIQRMLTWRPLVWIGLVSYSLYLWHWPLLVYTTYLNGMSPLPLSLKCLLFVTALIFAWASYRWVETPFRQNTFVPIKKLNRHLLISSLLVVVLLGCMAFGVKLDKGWQKRFTESVVKYDGARAPAIPYRTCDGAPVNLVDTNCTVGYADSRKLILLWGDSHALAWAPAFEKFAQSKKATGTLAVNSACPPLLGVNNSAEPGCKAANEKVWNWVKSQRPDQVYLVASWMSYSQPDGQYSLDSDNGGRGNLRVFSPALHRTIKALRPFVRQILLIGPTPGAPDDVPFKLALSELRAEAPPSPKTHADFLERSKWFWKAAKIYRNDLQVVLIDPSEWFCKNSYCQYLDNNGYLLYRDGGHLNIKGAEYVERYFPMQFLLDHPTKNEGSIQVAP